MDHSGPANRSKIPFFSQCIATGFFSGYIPWASGTFGSLVGVAIYLIPGFERAEILLVAIAVVLPLGAITSWTVAKSVGNQLTRSAAAAKAAFQPGADHLPDPSIVVIDEILGMWISLFMLPKTLTAVVCAFLLFRLFDIIKPPPARNLEAVPNGWGIMLDDAVAGIYANLGVRALMLVLPGYFS